MMSKLFNFSSLLTENAFNLVKTVKEKNYLSESVSILSEMDTNIQKITDNLYSSLLEAESKKEENSKFGEFYTEYKTELLRFKNKMSELAVQFCINLETYVDANSDTLDACCYGSPVEFQGVQYSKLLDGDTPNIDPYKAFKKEWAFIGRLLQDLDPSASDEEKTKVIATVYNSLSKEINDGWLDKCVQKIADCEECSRDNFAKVMYDKFVTNPNMQYQLDAPTVEQCKLVLKNYTNYTDCISKSADEFCCGIDKIACEIGSMLFRNMDKKFVVNTDVEGVANATYRLSDYSMNQINLFLTTKISQIRELANLYSVALSIKMDCIYNYFKQCVSMINSACDPTNTPAEDIQSTPDSGCDDAEVSTTDIEIQDTDDDVPELPEDNTGTSEPEEDSNTTIDNDVEGIENNEPVSTNAGEESQDSINDDAENDDDESEEESETSDDAEAVEPDQPQEESYISEIEKYIYLSEADIYFIQRYNKYKDLNNKYLTEADDNNQQQKSDNHADTPVSKDKTDTAENESVADRAKSIFQKVKDSIAKLKNSYDKTFAAQIKFISDNKSQIMGVNIPEKWTIQKYNISLLSSLRIVPFNIKDAELLKNENEYIEAKYGKYIAQGSNIGDRIIKKIFDDKEQKYGDAERNEGYDFVVNQYKKLMDNYNEQINKLADFYNKESKTTAVKKESALSIDDYFTEASDEGEANGNGVRWEAVVNYFLINQKVLTAMMNIYIKNFKKQYAFLKKLEKISK